MRIGSLFSGAGGLDMAVEAVFGAETAWHCEVDPAASKVLAHRFPDVPNLGDITKVDWAAVEPTDVLCGGYPCQPFSSAGQRKGSGDERHLWLYFAQAIRRVRPRYVVLENVAGHRSMGFDSVLADLATMRYDAEWCSLRAADVGAPHGRERLFVVAHPEYRTDDWQRARTQSRQGGSPIADSRGDGFVWGAELDIRPNQSELAAPQRRNADRRDVEASGPLNLLPTPQARDAAGAKTPEQVEAASGQFGPPMNLNDYVVNEASQWGKYEPAIRRWEQFTRPAPKPTELNKHGKPRLLAAFSEWLMGWPAGWVTQVPGISRNDQLRIIGNGVVPQQAEAALHYLLSVAEVAA